MRFEKISYEQWEQDYINIYLKDLNYYDFKNNKQDYYELDSLIKESYNNIKLPQRSTKHSAGYDFYTPFCIELSKGQSCRILTGIKWCGDYNNEVLILAPRSGLGTKYKMRLLNTIGVVDEDYQNATNEGHIQAFIEVGEDLSLEANIKFMQGITLHYIVADNAENELSERTGGFGSTDKQNN